MGIAWACMECQWWTGMGVAEWPMHVLARLGVMEARQKMQEEQDGD
jgi:hypothetical protein